MSIKLVIGVCLAVMVCFGCNKDEVKTEYVFSTDKVTAVVTDKDGLASDKKQILLNSLKKLEFIGTMKFSEASRAENDKLAEAKFEEKYKSIQKLDLKEIFGLESGESASVEFEYALTRGKEELAREMIEIVQPVVPVRD